MLCLDYNTPKYMSTFQR